jgi:hypothetical protein
VTSATPVHGVPDTVPECQDLAADDEMVALNSPGPLGTTPVPRPPPAPVTIDEGSGLGEANTTDDGMECVVMGAGKDAVQVESAPRSVGSAPSVKLNSLVSILDICPRALG